MEGPAQRTQEHIAMLPTPGMGHLIPFIELARKLLQLHCLTITFIIVDDGSPLKPRKALLDSFPAINSVFLPPASGADTPQDAKLETRIIHGVIRSVPAICRVLDELNRSSRVSAFVVDLFGTFTFDAVKELGIPPYVFFASPAMALAFTLHLPELDESCSCEYRDLPEPVKVPGCLPVHASDLTDSVQNRKNEVYKWILEMSKNYGSADGILVNSFLELEPDTFKAFEQLGGTGTVPPVYHVGPLTRPNSRSDSSEDRAECLNWLDKQPAGSVLFVSFGSGGSLSSAQLKELALGLEMSGQRFLWSARSPNDKAKDATYFTVDERKMDPFLSSDFMERTKEKGFVLFQWAPQIEVLSHPAVSGFLTHCGWNSSLESIVHGVPLIAWPLFAEQRMNAVLLSEGLKVALRVRENDKGIVDSEQISRLVRSLIEGEEGEELRIRMRNLKDVAARAFGEDGSSIKSLANVVAKWIGEE